MEQIRQVIAYKHYFLEFYEPLSDPVKEKIEWTLSFLKTQSRIPEKYFKHIEGTKGLYEVRIEFGSNIYRIFSFFDKGRLVVLGNGFQKKTNKTPKQEITKALRIMAEYYEDREEDHNS